MRDQDSDTIHRFGLSATKRMLVFTLLSLPLIAHSQGQPSAQPPDAIRATLQPLIDTHTIAGAVTLVATRDRILYLQPAGYRDLEQKAAMPPDAIFWIASTSKPMTVTAFMMLVDEGKVSVDDPVEKYLPEFHGQMVKAPKDANAPTPSGSPEPPQLVAPSHPILIREILSHTSGLPFKSSAQPGALDT